MGAPYIYIYDISHLRVNDDGQWTCAKHSTPHISDKSTLSNKFEK